MARVEEKKAVPAKKPASTGKTVKKAPAKAAAKAVSKPKVKKMARATPVEWNYSW